MDTARGGLQSVKPFSSALARLRCRPRLSRMSYGYGQYYRSSVSVEAYRASPVGSGRGGGGANGDRWRGGGSNDFGDGGRGEPHHGPEIYGFEHAGAHRVCPGAGVAAVQGAALHRRRRLCRSLRPCPPAPTRLPGPRPNAAGLPAFEGEVAGATVASGALAGAGAGQAAPEARYLALLCHEALLDFQQQHAWEAQLLPAVETGAGGVLVAGQGLCSVAPQRAARACSAAVPCFCRGRRPGRILHPCLPQ